MSYFALQAKTNRSLNRTSQFELGAQLRAYQYYVTVCLSVQPVLRSPSRHGSGVCLSECRQDDQPGEWTLFIDDLQGTSD